MFDRDLIRRATSLLQYFLIFIDVLANVLSDFGEIDLFIRLSLYIVQDVALLISLIVLILLLFQQHILVNKLLKRTFLHFSFQIVLILIYLVLTFVLQSINVTTDQKHLQSKSTNIIYLFIIQRILAALYYVQYKVSSDQLLTQRFIQTIKQNWLQFCNHDCRRPSGIINTLIRLESKLYKLNLYNIVQDIILNEIDTHVL